MKSMASENSNGCPLEVVHRRMDDAHQLWHMALDFYQEPSQFSLHLRNCILTLRTVTFLLQSKKSVFPDFDTWYEPWRDELRTDSVMRWAVEARNKVEKQGDLESRSTISAHIIASHYDEIPLMKVEVSLTDTVQAMLSRIPRAVLSQQVLRHGCLKIQRCWVDSEFSDWEILDALAHVYGRLSELIDDAHEQLGLEHGLVAHVSDDGEIHTVNHKLDAHKGRLPCMVTTDADRSVLISLADGANIRFDHVAHRMTEESGRAALERYGLNQLLIGSAGPKPFPELSHTLFQMARAVFLRDGYHQTMAFFIRGQEYFQPHALQIEDRMEKYLMMRHLADEGRKCGADGFIMIGEIWVAKVDEVQPFRYPEDQKDRGEDLMLSACSRDGGDLQLRAEIKRDGDEVSLGETEQTSWTDMPILQPIKDIWLV